MTEQKNRSASSRFLGNLSWSQDTNTRKPTHGNYRFLPHPATELRSSFHGPDLPDIRGDRHGLDHLEASPLRDEVIFSSGRVGDGHWTRFHRFFSHAAWDIDTFSRNLAKLVVTILAPGATFFWAVDDTLCRKRGLTLYGAGMHDDPLISSRSKSLVSWGHNWVVLTLIVAFPVWAPSKVFALSIAMRLYRNRQGLTKGKKNPKGKKGQQKPTKPMHDPNHRTRPELALELIIMVASGFPTMRSSSPVTAPTAVKASSLICRQRSPHQPCASNGALYEPAPPKKEKRKGPARKKGDRLHGMSHGRRSGPTVEELEFDSGCTNFENDQDTRLEGPISHHRLDAHVEGNVLIDVYCSKR